MAKKSRTKSRESAPAEGAVGPRQPCPCGSGKRYKACHGAAGGHAPVFVARPFEGMPNECDVIALRELVPAATAPLTLEDGDRTVRLCTLLPGAAPALVRDSGEIWLGLQVQHQYGDPARDLGAVLAAYRGALLPASEAPAVRELRERTGSLVRQLVMDSGSWEQLAAYAHLPEAQEDEDVLMTVLRLAPPDAPERAGAVVLLEAMQARSA